MLSTQSQRPAAALDLERMASTLNHSFSRRGRMFLKFCLGTWPASILSLKVRSSSKNLLTSFIICWLAFQEASILPLPPGWRRYTQAPVTSSMPAGGLARDLSSPRSFLLRESRAAAAFSRAGSAAARSFSILIFISLTATSFSAAADAITLALAASSAALAFSSSSLGIMASHLIFFSSTSTCFTLRSSSRSPTSLAVFSSLVTPEERRWMLCSVAPRRRASMLL
mmetsp:Transcript_23409/g.78735  ORF Transcript_23409/g.78735 Transcript_23409/m.78735 type:complete len:226 (-) Transcript_23409:2068-2745(-)